MPKAKKKKVKTKVKRLTNGQIIKGSSRLKGSGRPKGARSTGKLKSVSNSKSSKPSKSIKSVGSTKKSIESVPKRHISTTDKKAGIIRIKGRIQKGSASIGGGRKAGYSKADRLEGIIAEVSIERGKKEWLKDLIRRSYKDTQLSIALLGRLFPALKAIEVSALETDPDYEKDCSDIRKEIRGRFAQPKTIDELRAEIANLENVERQNNTSGVQNE